MSYLEKNYWDFLRLKRQYPGAGYIEIRPDWRERLPGKVGASGRLLRDSLRHARSVLDVGAGDRFFEDVLQKLGVMAAYKSVDLETLHSHDYRDFLAVTERFDAILMLEVIEHLPLDKGIDYMTHAMRLLQPGGRLIISTPNASHPNHVWRVEVAHIRPWPAADLYGVLCLLGFRDVQLYRQFLVASAKRRVFMGVEKALYRIMELDHAQGLIAIARRSSYRRRQRSCLFGRLIERSRRAATPNTTAIGCCGRQPSI
jgi:SAM-dependent methyltransferase